MESLYLDIGNSFLKMVARNGSDWEILFAGEINRVEELCKKIESISESKKIVVSSVRRDVIEKLNKNLSKADIHEYRTSDIPAEKLQYNTPETLGLDRFLVCLGASKESGNKNLVVIDAGSACTVDLMTDKGVYNGGVIMPGLQVIQRAIENRLPELPVVSDSIPETWPGKSTMESIEWGVNGGFVHAITGFIEQYRLVMGEIDIYITGGDAPQLLKWMGNKIPLIHRKNLIWDGMEIFGNLVKKANSTH